VQASVLRSSSWWFPQNNQLTGSWLTGLTWFKSSGNFTGISLVARSNQT
jgi:hypothetical protein